MKQRLITQAAVTAPGMNKIHTKTVGDLLRVLFNGRQKFKQKGVTSIVDSWIATKHRVSRSGLAVDFGCRCV